MFAWLRPDDLIWNYWVNNYLQGKTPPAFDILYWNADVTRLPAALHHDFIRLGLANALVTPGAATMLGSPVDLAKVDVDAYLVAGITDHLCPWESCYRTTQLLGGPVKFVLSTSGHIAAMVNPPGQPQGRVPHRFPPRQRPVPSPGRRSMPPPRQRPIRGQSARPARVPGHRDHGAGQLVDRLRGLAGRTRRRAAQEPADARPQGLPGAGAAPGTYVHDR